MYIHITHTHTPTHKHLKWLDSHFSDGFEHSDSGGHVLLSLPSRSGVKQPQMGSIFAPFITIIQTTLSLCLPSLSSALSPDSGRWKSSGRVCRAASPHLQNLCLPARFPKESQKQQQRRADAPDGSHSCVSLLG